MFHVGFTGTARGLTDVQRIALTDEMSKVDRLANQVVAHHGDCIGGDAIFHDVAWHLGWIFEIHPPDSADKRAFCEDEWPSTTTFIHEKKPPLDRNHDIVDFSEALIACPKGMTEELRSGTWATVRYARKDNKPYVLIFPDGTVERHD